MNYLQEHDNDLKRRLVSLAHFDTTTENDELVTLLTIETFREHMSTFWKRTKAETTLSLLVAVHADGGCAIDVHQR